MDDQDDIIREFLVESHENLDQLDRDLVALEKEPQDRERLASVFRAIHTIKGTCGFLAYPKLEAVAHAGESLLSQLRDGQLTLNVEITSGLLALVDAVRNILAKIESTGQEGDGAYDQVIARVTQLRVIDKETRRQGDKETKPLPSQAPPEEPSPSLSPCLPVSLSPCLPVSLSGPPAPEEAAARDVQAGGVADASIRVDVGLLDRLVNLVGELVLARNQVLQFTATRRDPAFLHTTQRPNQITTELQEGVMKTRMQPIGNILNKFPRQVRDLAVACGKQVVLTLEGEETELDKTLLEAIKDPLTHLVRNAVDHGIEPPEERVALGKPPEGRLSLHAFHEGGQVNIEIADDGRGIDPERVRRKALERGLVPRDVAARLTERELLQLIFLPGFSTAEKVTNVSGRGVGMDVVKTNIEKIGGAVDIVSRPGHGAAVKIKIPLTLAIIPALIVSSGGDRYAIPQVSLLELVRLDGEKARRGLERIHGVPVYRLRGALLPLVFLHKELRVEPMTAPSGSEPLHIAVLQAGERPFGLVVEAINDTEEIVVKPLSKHLKGIPLFAGATIMGDGKVSLILDILGLAQRAGVVSEVRGRKPAEPPTLASQRRPGQVLVLFRFGDGRRMAVPLSLVARLEEFRSAAVEKTAGGEVVQYGEKILPLVYLDQVFPGSVAEPRPAGESVQVLVFSAHGRSIGLVVGRILDIVETADEMQPATRRDGVLGSVVLQQRVTDLLDVHAVIRAADATFFDQPALV
jgi:two-component system, chemotaxis family, sensor kinase CheA